ncbi:MAG: Hsp20/alpha crystallin family protein [Lachnospiraceae bacterium]
MLRTYNLFDNLFDDMFDDSFFKSPSASTANLMRTDIREKDDQYMLDIELPGYKKEDLQAELKDGYLTIAATHNETSEEKNEKGKFLRRERYSGSVKRSFYLGDNVKQEDIQAAFNDGVLTLTVAKPQAKQVPERKMISIQ